MTPRAPTLVLVSGLAAACSVRPLAATATDTTSTTTTSATSTSDTSGLPTTAIPATTTSTTSTSDPLTSSTTAIPDHPFDWRCTPALQDCPDGQKCVPYSDGNWELSRCVPVSGSVQPGEPCTVQGSHENATDDCELGAWCWTYDETPICVELCRGPGDVLRCDDEAQFDCHLYLQATIGFCLPNCNVLTQDCPGDDLCLPADDTFLCAPPSDMPGQLFASCAGGGTTSCAQGLWCMPAASALECDQDASDCCEPFCNLNDPDSVCPGAGQICASIYGSIFVQPAPAPYAHIGICTRPL